MTELLTPAIVLSVPLAVITLGVYPSVLLIFALIIRWGGVAVVTGLPAICLDLFVTAPVVLALFVLFLGPVGEEGAMMSVLLVLPGEAGAIFACECDR